MRIFLALLLALTPALAEAKPKGCFTKIEHQAEQTVRHGIFLREYAVRCEEPPFNMKTLDLWKNIDQRIVADFAKQTDLRRKAFEREFPSEHNAILEVWDGRLVMRHRHAHVTIEACEDVLEQLQTIAKKGFKQFKTYATKIKPQVIYDYRMC